MLGNATILQNEALNLSHEKQLELSGVWWDRNGFVVLRMCPEWDPTCNGLCQQVLTGQTSGRLSGRPAGLASQWCCGLALASRPGWRARLASLAGPAGGLIKKLAFSKFADITKWTSSYYFIILLFLVKTVLSKKRMETNKTI